MAGMVTKHNTDDPNMYYASQIKKYIRDNIVHYDFINHFNVSVRREPGSYSKYYIHLELDIDFSKYIMRCIVGEFLEHDIKNHVKGDYKLEVHIKEKGHHFN